MAQVVIQKRNDELYGQCFCVVRGDGLEIGFIGPVHDGDEILPELTIMPYWATAYNDAETSRGVKTLLEGRLFVEEFYEEDYAIAMEAI